MEKLSGSAYDEKYAITYLAEKINKIKEDSTFGESFANILLHNRLSYLKTWLETGEVPSEYNSNGFLPNSIDSERYKNEIINFSEENGVSFEVDSIEDYFEKKMLNEWKAILRRVC